MITGLAYVLTSLTLVILLPFLLAGAGHEQVGDAAIYRHPRRVALFFLWLLPVYVTMGLIIYGTMSPADRVDLSNAGPFAIFWAFVLALLVTAYFYFDRYRVQIDSQGVTISTISRVKAIPLARIAHSANRNRERSCNRLIII